MFGVNRKMFIGLLTSIVSASNHTKCISLSNQKCMTQVALIDLHTNEYSQELCYYPFVFNLGGCFGSCNTLDDLPDRAQNINKTYINVLLVA